MKMTIYWKMASEWVSFGLLMVGAFIFVFIGLAQVYGELNGLNNEEQPAADAIMDSRDAFQ